MASDYHQPTSRQMKEISGETLTSLGANILAHGVQAVLYTGVAERIYSKYKYSLEPIHIYELNNLTNWALLAMLNALTALDIFFDDSDWFCSIVHFALYYVIFSFYLGMLITQADRFLALYWSVKYTSRVTKKKAVMTVGISKLVIFIIIIIAAVLDGKILQCFDSTFYGCRMQKGMFLWVTFPMMFTLMTVLGVSMYVLHIIVKQSRKVAPIVCINTISAMVKEDEDNHDHQDHQDHPDQLTVEDIEVSSDVESQEVEERKIRRRDTDPYMFYREEQLMTQQRVSFKCFNFKTRILDSARRALRMNLVTLSLLVMMAPHNLLNVYFYFSESGGCTADRVTISRLVGSAQYFFVMIYPFILMSKLSKTSS